MINSDNVHTILHNFGHPIQRQKTQYRQAGRQTDRHIQMLEKDRQKREPNRMNWN